MLAGRVIFTLFLLVSLSATGQQPGIHETGDGGAASPAITREQADAILDELKAIHRLLERDSNRNGLPAPRARAPVHLKIDPSLPSIGREDAPLTLVEFSDYQCPFCKRFHAATFAQIKKAYVDTGLLKVVFHDLPLPMHRNAVIAAEAARCAADQGKFAPMHDLLMSTATTEFNTEAVLAYGRQTGMDEGKFKSCIENHKFQADVQKAAADAMATSISGTPTFVLAKTANDELSGDVLTGALPFAIFESAIKHKLEEK